MGEGEDEKELAASRLSVPLRRYARSTEPTDDELARVAARLEADVPPTRPSRAGRSWRPWAWSGGAGLAAASAALVLFLRPESPAEQFRGPDPAPAVGLRSLEGLQPWELEEARAVIEDVVRRCPIPPDGVELVVSPEGVVKAGEGQAEAGACFRRTLPTAPLVRTAPDGSARRFRVAPAADVG